MGAVILMCKATSGITPLQGAFMNGRLEVVNFFIDECKCNIESNALERSPLQLAAGHGNLHLLRCLIEDREMQPYCHYS